MKKLFYLKGFTLVEAMIVVAIVAVVAAIAIPNLLRSRIVANESFACTTLKAISAALEGYFSANGVYPDTTDTLKGDVPPYLTIDYFQGTHAGYIFQMVTLEDYDYDVIATPVSGATGKRSFHIVTGGVLNEISSGGSST